MEVSLRNNGKRSSKPGYPCGVVYLEINATTDTESSLIRRIGDSDEEFRIIASECSNKLYIYKPDRKGDK